MWPKIIDRFIALALVGVCAAAAILGYGFFSYRAGAINSPRSDAMLTANLILQASAIAALFSLIGGIVRFARWPWTTRIAWIVLMLAPLPLLVIGDAVGGSGENQYQLGFQQWTQTHIDDVSIRTWLATTKPPPELLPTPVPPSDWPPAVTTLRPTDVYLCHKGALVSWGPYGDWGEQRQVFIANFPIKKDPGIMLWAGYWHEVSPGKEWPSPWIEMRPGLFAMISPGD